MSSDIEKAHDDLTRRVIDWEGVSGTAIGVHRGAPCIKVYLSRPASELMGKLPRSVGGFHVVVEETGVFRPL